MLQCLVEADENTRSGNPVQQCSFEAQHTIALFLSSHKWPKRQSKHCASLAQLELLAKRAGASLAGVRQTQTQRISRMLRVNCSQTTVHLRLAKPGFFLSKLASGSLGVTGNFRLHENNFKDMPQRRLLSSREADRGASFGKPRNFSSKGERFPKAPGASNVLVVFCASGSRISCLRHAAVTLG